MTALAQARDAIQGSLRKQADEVTEETAAELLRFHEHVKGRTYTAMGFDGERWRIEFHVIEAEAVPLRVLWLMVKTWWRWVCM